MRLHTWLETEYNRTPHSGLDSMTPLDAWMSKSKFIIAVDPSVNLNRAFYHTVTRRVYNDNTFTLDGYLYEVPITFKGSTITIVYDPHLPVLRPLIRFDGADIDSVKLVDSYANSKIKRNLTSNYGCCTPSVAQKEIDTGESNNPVKAVLSASKINLNEKDK
jgi:hypothetical protein